MSEKEGLKPEQGIALCLSGGGYRALLFHLGALYRINEIGLLKKIDRISSVSGGSILAGLLGVKWCNLIYDDDDVAINFKNEIANPIILFTQHTIDIQVILKGIFLPGSVGDFLASVYDKHLFGNFTLQDLPDRPRIVINATNIQSGALFRFSKPYARDYLVGEIKWPKLKLSKVVAASTAFPPFLSPLILKLKQEDFTAGSNSINNRSKFPEKICLTDGGVYDNLGLETAIKRYDTILVSDGGAALEFEEKSSKNWLFHSIRVLKVIDNQVRSLRKRQLIDNFKNEILNGAYWGIRTNIDDYGLENNLKFSKSQILKLSNITTRLKKLNNQLQYDLINWGYSVCDAAIRKYLFPKLPPPVNFPFLMVH